jgi:hypothetical protein
MPESRTEDCPAAVVCDSVGNLRKSCIKGGIILDDEEKRIQRCMAGIILLLDRFSRANVVVHLSSEPAPPNGELSGDKEGDGKKT